MLIRRAVLSDAAGIGRVHVDSWRTTYEEIIPQEYLNSLSYGQRTLLWERNLGMTDSYNIVAENESGDVIGFASASRKEGEENACVLTSIYLLQEYHGQGIGKKLLKATFEYMKQINCETVYVHVLEKNKTRHLYEYLGAKRIETNELAISKTPLNEQIYQWNNINHVLEKLT